MELLQTDYLGPVAADTWSGMGTTIAGPRAVLFMVNCPLADTETMQVQVLVNPDDSGVWAVVEDFTSAPTDYSSFSGSAGFQSAPVPLVDDLWKVFVHVKHDSATARTFAVRTIAL
jgi:hypothetical protein